MNERTASASCPACGYEHDFATEEEMEAAWEKWSEAAFAFARAQGRKPQRWAVVSNATSSGAVGAYLPENYYIVQTVDEPDGRCKVVISGHDVAGWTLDDYVIPRLGTGNFVAREYPSHAEAVEAAAAAMN
jgi:hypothetical protein